jgi:hypothetical protein
MVDVDHTEPADVVDPLLWREAQHMLGRHAEPDLTGRCGWCGERWPCSPRRLAERAEAASRRPWRESWTARHELNALRAVSGGGRRLGPSRQGRPSGGAPPGRRPGNRGLFD